MSSKSKRRVTVDPGNTVSDDAEKRKPSVFERLGPGAGQRIEGRIERKYTDYDSEREREKKCRPFLLTGECPYGATCKYKHVQLSRKSRSREEDASPENLRLKLKGGQSERSGDKRRDSDSESRDPPARSSSHSRRDKDSETTSERTDRPSRRDKETKIRSQVVVKKSENQDSDDSGDDSDSNWFSTLDYKKELELEQKRQQLQRELSQLAEEEVENITIQKKVPVSPSDSDSSPERGRPSKRVPSPHDKRAATSPHDKRSTSPGGRSKKEKKKHRTKSPPELPSIRDKKITSPPAFDKPREHKRKHEAEEESHKKHKKKKERKRSLTPPPSASVIRAKKKDKWDEPESSTSRTHTDNTSSSRQHSLPHSKHSRSSSSESSTSPPRPKEVKVKAKAKAKKKKSRAGKGDSDSDESHTKSKKWLSPLKKTLKLKKTKASSVSGDTKLDEGHLKQRSASPKAARRGDRRDLLVDEPVLLSRSHESRREAEIARSRGRSSEKREKKMKGRQSESPAPQLDRSGSTKRGGDSSRDTSFSRKGRQSESPPLPTERSSGRRGDSSRDLPFDRRKLEQRGERGESRKAGGGEERQKRPPSPPLPPPPRQTEMYSPSQLDRDTSPVREPPQRQPPPASRGRQVERDPPPRDEERRGGPDRDGGRRGEKFEPRSSSSSQDRAGQDRFGRRGGGDGDSFDQYGQDRGQFDADRNRWEYRDSRGGGQDAGEREPRGRRGDHFERGSSQRDQPRGEGMGRDASFDRADSLRGSGGRDGRDVSRDNEGRERGRDAPRDRGDNRGRDRDGRGALAEGGKYGSGTSGPDGQRRSGQWEAGNRSGEWGSERGDPSRDPPAGGRLEERGRMYRDDGREGSDRRGRDIGPEGRQPLDGGRMDRPDSRPDSRDSRLDRGDSRVDRGGDSRMERGDSRGERLDRGDSRLDSRGDRGLPRGGEGRLDRGDNRMERGVDNPMDHHRGEPPVPPVDQRGFRQGRGMGSGDGRGGSMRGVGSRGSPAENRGGFDRRGDTVGGRPGDRESRMDRDLGGMGQPPPPRDRFLPGPDFRRDEPPGFRDNVPDSGAMRDRRGDDRFIGPDAIDLPPRGDRRFEDVRDDRMSGRGPPGEGRDRIMSHRGGHFDFGRGPGPDVRPPPPLPPPPDLLPNQRRGPLLPTPVEEPRRGDTYDREPPRMGREGSRDSRSRRDQRDGADFGPQMGRGGRDPSREGMRDPPTWERDSNKDGRLSGRDNQRDPPGRRSGGGGFAAPGEDFTLPDADRKRRDRERSPRRDGDRTKDSPAQDRKDEPGNGGKDGARGERGDASDARSTRSADDVREMAGQRGGKEGEAAGGGAGVGKGVRDRDTRSDGKRSPDQNQGKGEPSLPFSGRRQPVRARSLSPKQRSSKMSGGGEPGRSPGRRRSPPSRRTGDHSSSPTSRSSQGGRSRTPIGTKRKLEEDLRSPRGKDDTKSPLAKRAREDSKSPARKTSRHPSPAGSHHSRGSHSSERRKRPGLTQREPESRFFGSGHDNRDSPARRDKERERDSPAWRDAEKDSPARRDRDRERDKESKIEKTSESSKGDSDKTEGSRKRGRSPPRSRGRGSDSGDRGHKRWRGEKVHPAIEAAWQAGFGPADIESKLAKLLDPFRQRQLQSLFRNRSAQKVVLDKRYDRERLISESDDLVILFDCKRQSMVDWFVRKDRKHKMTHFEEDAQNCVKVWSAVSDPKFQSYCLMLSTHTRLLAAAIRRFLDGSWSEAEGAADTADKDSHKKSSGAEQSKAGEDLGEGGDAGKTPSSNMAPSADAGKSIRAGRGDSFSGRGGEDRGQAEGYPLRGEDSFHRGPGRSGEAEGRGESSLPQDGADDSKDASLKNMLYEDDYEKISSDESDFEADDGEKQTQSIVSVLDIDWASLAKQPVPKQTTGSLLKRFHPANVFRQIGVSRALAGQSLFEKIEAICKEGVAVEDGKENGKDKESAEQSTETPPAKGGGKKIDTSLLSDVPVLHMAAVRQKRERANLLHNLGPFRRALCARRDLEIRRQLCKVDKVYEQPAVFPTSVMDTDLCKLSMQLFRQGRDFVERKDSECDSKIELTL